jgi:hypothetical protein
MVRTGQSINYLNKQPRRQPLKKPAGAFKQAAKKQAGGSYAFSLR